MPMAAMRAAIVAMVVISCIARGVAGGVEDGLPRPTNFPVAPTTSYGPQPMLYTSDGAMVDCEWYGFANELYSAAQGDHCLWELRDALTNSTVNPASALDPYLYYTLRRLIDPANNESYCYQGCFNFRGALAPEPAYEGTPAPSPGGYVRGPALAPEYPPYQGPIVSDPGPVESPISYGPVIQEPVEPPIYAPGYGVYPPTPESGR